MYYLQSPMNKIKEHVTRLAAQELLFNKIRFATNVDIL